MNLTVRRQDTGDSRQLFSPQPPISPHPTPHTPHPTPHTLHPTSPTPNPLFYFFPCL
ncbi:hypothetical protein O53_5046 [Microcystis aeruginosa TAIHU98]|uniref:Uncharacterized protein n=1 Tax=Microcystis aeruginosa TAIHU98 TaxID=1134457 RepID=L7DZX1_MICAE|nr:hypothetical protein O53_5046 [Microcystis aeruginosa TAIHU98]